jgi:hypothetical protein
MLVLDGLLLPNPIILDSMFHPHLDLETGESKEESSKGSDEIETNTSKYLSVVKKNTLSSLLQWYSNIKISNKYQSN